MKNLRSDIQFYTSWEFLFCSGISSVVSPGLQSEALQSRHTLPSSPAISQNWDACVHSEFCVGRPRWFSSWITGCWSNLPAWKRANTHTHTHTHKDAHTKTHTQRHTHCSLGRADQGSSLRWKTMFSVQNPVVKSCGGGEGISIKEAEHEVALCRRRPMFLLAQCCVLWLAETP